MQRQLEITYLELGLLESIQITQITIANPFLHPSKLDNVTIRLLQQQSWRSNLPLNSIISQSHNHFLARLQEILSGIRRLRFAIFNPNRQWSSGVQMNPCSRCNLNSFRTTTPPSDHSVGSNFIVHQELSPFVTRKYCGWLDQLTSFRLPRAFSI